MSLTLTYAGSGSLAPLGALRWGDGFFVWESDNADTGALLWNNAADGLIWE